MTYLSFNLVSSASSPASGSSSSSSLSASPSASLPSVPSSISTSSHTMNGNNDVIVNQQSSVSKSNNGTQNENFIHIAQPGEVADAVVSSDSSSSSSTSAAVSSFSHSASSQDSTNQTKQLSQQISDQIHQAQEQIIASINESQQYLIHQLLESQRQLFSSMSTFPLEIPSLQFRELVRNGSVTASDSYNDYSIGVYSLLNAVWENQHSQAWVTSRKSWDENSQTVINNPYIQVVLPAMMTISAIRIQGRTGGQPAKQWITEFQLKFQTDDPSSDWIDMGTPSSFDGCHDTTTIITHDLTRYSIRARRVRLYPLKANNWISLRWEVVFKP